MLSYIIIQVEFQTPLRPFGETKEWNTDAFDTTTTKVEKLEQQMHQHLKEIVKLHFDSHQVLKVANWTVTKVRKKNKSDNEC